MKHLFRTTAFLTLTVLSLILLSCSEDDATSDESYNPGNGEGIVTVDGTEYELKGIGAFQITEYDNGVFVYDLTLADLPYVAHINSETVLYFSVRSVGAVEPEEGTYTYDGTEGDKTLGFLTSVETAQQYYDCGNSGSTMTLAKSGDNYIIDFSLVTDDGATITGSFTGNPAQAN